MRYNIHLNGRGSVFYFAGSERWVEMPINGCWLDMKVIRIHDIFKRKHPNLEGWNCISSNQYV